MIAIERSSVPGRTRDRDKRRPMALKNDLGRLSSSIRPHSLAVSYAKGAGTGAKPAGVHRSTRPTIARLAPAPHSLAPARRSICLTAHLHLL